MQEKQACGFRSHPEPSGFNTGGNRCFDALQEPEELLMAMSRLTISDDGSFQDIQGGKQRGRSMPLIIVRLSGGQSGA